MKTKTNLKADSSHLAFNRQTKDGEQLRVAINTMREHVIARLDGRSAHQQMPRIREAYNWVRNGFHAEQNRRLLPPAG